MEEDKRLNVDQDFRNLGLVSSLSSSGIKFVTELIKDNYDDSLRKSCLDHVYEKFFFPHDTHVSLSNGQTSNFG